MVRGHQHGPAFPGVRRVRAPGVDRPQQPSEVRVLGEEGAIVGGGEGARGVARLVGGAEVHEHHVRVVLGEPACRGVGDAAVRARVAVGFAVVVDPSADHGAEDTAADQLRPGHRGRGAQTRPGCHGAAQEVGVAGVVGAGEVVAGHPVTVGPHPGQHARPARPGVGVGHAGRRPVPGLAVGLPVGQQARAVGARGHQAVQHGCRGRGEGQPVEAQPVHADDEHLGAWGLGVDVRHWVPLLCGC